MKKVVFICLTVFTMFLLTGCGAEVTSKTVFQPNSSGERTVTAIIEGKKIKKLENGYDDIDKILNEAAPEGVSLNRTMLDDKTAQYQFSFSFDSISDYNQKVEKITGKQHDATWATGTSVFLSDVSFTETECTYDLVSWAIEALKNSEYGEYFEKVSYENGKNDVYYGDELVYSGNGNPSFSRETSPGVKSVTMYSDYNQDGTSSKKLILQFENGGLENINTEEANKLLKAYSNNFKMDLANSTITYTLEKDEIYKFLSCVDLSMSEEDLVYKATFNALQTSMEIKEAYSLEQFLSLFKMNTQTVTSYVKLPSDMEGIQLNYTTEQEGEDTTDGYIFAGTFRYNEKYELSASWNKMAEFVGAKIVYTIQKNLGGEKYIEIRFSSNGCAVNKKQLLQYYPDLKDNITFSKDDDYVALEITQKFEEGDILEDMGGTLSVEKIKRQSIKSSLYQLKDSTDIVKYLPDIDGYEWKLDGLEYEYQVSMPKVSGLKNLTFNGTTYDEKGKDGNKKIDTLLLQGLYTIKGTQTFGTPISLEIEFSKTDDLFYLKIIGVLFIIIIIILLLVLLKGKGMPSNKRRSTNKTKKSNRTGYLNEEEVEEAIRAKNERYEEIRNRQTGTIHSDVHQDVKKIEVDTQPKKNSERGTVEEAIEQSDMEAMLKNSLKKEGYFEDKKENKSEGKQ